MCEQPSLSPLMVHLEGDQADTQGFGSNYSKEHEQFCSLLSISSFAIIFC